MKTEEPHKLSRQNTSPLYRQLMEQIRERIELGELAPGQALMSEREMCRAYGVSQITVRQAITRLAQDGWVESVPGKGSFVCERREGNLKLATGLPIGVVLPANESLINKAFTADFIMGFGAVAGEFEYTINVYESVGVNYFQDAFRERLQGLVVTGLGVAQWRLFQKAGIPFVLVGDWDEEGVYVADVDNVNVSRMQTRHLIEQGCRRIGMVLGHSEESPFGKDRRAGWLAAHEDAGLDADARLVQEIPFTAEAGYAAARTLIAEEVDGLVCVDDIVATGAARAVFEAGLRIPEDLAIIGCNNTCIGQNFRPQLSTVDLEPTRLGRIAAEKLIQLLRGEKPPRRTTISGHLVVRNSSIRTPVCEDGGII